MIKRIFNCNKILSEKNSFFLFGPRGVGKTSLVNAALGKVKRHSIVIDLLHSETLRRYQLKPELLRKEVDSVLQSKTDLIVFIDEIQRVPALLDEIHSIIETFGEKVQFIMSGSSARKLKRSGANLLAGRAFNFTLHPFTFEEVDIDLVDVLLTGTIPKPFLNPRGAKRFLKAYLDTYLREEVQQEALVRKLEPFIRFLDLAGQFNGVSINESKIAKQVGVSPHTIRQYLSILTETLIAARIDPWSFSVIKQLQQSPRYYIFDCGVLNALTGELATPPRVGTYRYGKLFETFIVNEIIRYNLYHELEFRMFCYRTDSGSEVDLILARGPHDTPRAVEIKSTTAPDISDIKGLLSLKKNIPNAKLFCLCTTPRAYNLEGIEILPWKEGIKQILVDS